MDCVGLNIELAFRYEVAQSGLCKVSRSAERRIVEDEGLGEVTGQKKRLKL
jgi:hypothetical protein